MFSSSGNRPPSFEDEQNATLHNRILPNFCCAEVARNRGVMKDAVAIEGTRRKETKVKSVIAGLQINFIIVGRHANNK